MNRKFGAGLLAAIIALSMPGQVLASNLTDAEKKQKNLQQQLSGIKSEKSEVKQLLAANKEKRDEIVKNLEDKGYEKQAIEEKLAQLDSAIASLTGAIAQSETEYAAELALFQERIVVMYQRSKGWRGIDFALNSANLSEFYKNQNAMKSVSRADQDMMASLQAKKAEIESLKLQKLEEEATTQEMLEAKLASIKDLQNSRSQVDQEI